MTEPSLDLWMNVAVGLAFVGFAAYLSCLKSTTWHGEESEEER